MANIVRYEVKAKVGGTAEKPMWGKIGVVMQGDKGFSLRINTIPVNWDGYAFLSEPQEKPQQGHRQQSRPAPPARNGYSNKDNGFEDEMDQDIPF